MWLRTNSPYPDFGGLELTLRGFKSEKKPSEETKKHLTYASPAAD